VSGWFESKSEYKIVVKNFNKDAKNVRIDVSTNNKNVLSSDLPLKGQSSEYFSISDLAPGTTKISINSDDALAVDNSVYIIIPDPIKQSILYITDNAKSPSAVALGLLPDTTVNKVNPGNIPQLSGNIVFVSAALSHDAIKKLTDFVNSGGNAVIIASPGLTDMDLLPVECKALTNKTSLNIVQSSMMTSGIGIEKTEVKKHFRAQLKKGAVSLVEGGDASVMLAYWNFGKGLVIYSGFADPQGDNIYDPLNEKVWNDFHTLPAYPLFWKQMLEWISGTLDVSEYNAKTGMFIKLPGTQVIKTPADTVTTDTLLLDEVGVYKIPGKDVAVNLYDEKESNLAGAVATSANASKTGEIPSSIQTILKPKYFDTYLIIGAMFFVLFELYYLRWRGEL